MGGSVSNYTTASLAIRAVLCAMNKWCFTEIITNTVTIQNFDVILGKFNVIRISTSGIEMHH
jgi:hypothetical protein